jgi:hypothetical protein
MPLARRRAKAYLIAAAIVISLHSHIARGQATDSAVRCDLAEQECAHMLESFMQRADEQALAAGERFLKANCEEKGSFKLRQAEAIVIDLKRRKKQGSFGKQREATLPRDIGRWSAERKIAYLIDALDEIDLENGGTRGQRMATLIAIDEPAVPALLDAIERDERLTRLVEFKGGRVSSNAYVTTVADLELDAVMAILRVDLTPNAPAGEGLLPGGGLDRKRVPMLLRAYWKTYGKFPFDERMMKIITDPHSRAEATREAAANLAHLDELRVPGHWYGLTMSSLDRQPDPQPLRSPGPVVAKFTNPTAAQAILAAMDRDLKIYDSVLPDPQTLRFLPDPRQQAYLRDWGRRWIEHVYFESLIDLGDQRIAAELVRRLRSAKTIRERRLLASAANQLGTPGPMADFARDVENGTLELPSNDVPNLRANDEPATVELHDIIRDLIRTGTPAADRALFAIAAPQHRYYEIAACRLLVSKPGLFDGANVWFSHPYCLRILRHELENKDPSCEVLGLSRQKLLAETKEGKRPGDPSGARLEWLAHEVLHPSQAVDAIERRYQAAERIQRLVLGWPAYHPGRKEDDLAQATMLLFDRFPSAFRRLTSSELESLGFDREEILFVPDLKPLGRPATEGDVKAGRAIFHLGAKARLADLQLPAVAIPKRPDPAPDKFGRRRRFLILQAEVDDSGNTVYGVVGDGIPRTAKPEEFAAIRPIDKGVPTHDRSK